MRVWRRLSGLVCAADEPSVRSGSSENAHVLLAKRGKRAAKGSPMSDERWK